MKIGDKVRTKKQTCGSTNGLTGVVVKVWTLPDFDGLVTWVRVRWHKTWPDCDYIEEALVLA